MAESHTTYLPLVRFRSPRPSSSWVISLLAVLDSAALHLPCPPAAAPIVPARLCLRGGFGCLTRVAQAMGIDVPDEGERGGRDHPDLRGVPRRASPGWRRSALRSTREPSAAWPDFVGWRVNYERAAYQIADAIDAVPGLWSGPRREGGTQMAPRRPPSGRQR